MNIDVNLEEIVRHLQPAAALFPIDSDIKGRESFCSQPQRSILVFWRYSPRIFPSISTLLTGIYFLIFPSLPGK
jgi:hypothetical protein